MVEFASQEGVASLRKFLENLTELPNDHADIKVDKLIFTHTSMFRVA